MSLQNLSECIVRYGAYSRGPNCYKTNHWGAFHRHYQIKPEIKRDGGLVHGKDVGLHDSDYYLEVKATNKALLSTVLTKKVTYNHHETKYLLKTISSICFTIHIFKWFVDNHRYFASTHGHCPRRNQRNR